MREEETAIAVLKWFKQTKNHQRAFRNVVMDAQWYTFVVLFIFSGLFAATAIAGKPLLGLWTMALLSIQMLFSTAMNYAEID